jgi:hypothetical protein
VNFYPIDEMTDTIVFRIGIYIAGLILMLIIAVLCVIQGGKK